MSFRLGLLLVAGYSALMTFPRLGERGLTASHEARAAQHARAMLDSGDRLMPRLFDGQADYQKPPAYYWLCTLAWLPLDRGEAALAVRLPAAAAALFTSLAVYGYLAARGRVAAGVIAALALVTAVRFTGSARVARIDMPMTFCVAAGLLLFAAPAAGGGRWLLRPAGWALLAGAVLLKGPVGLALPLAVLAARPGVWRGQLRPHAAGFALFLLLAVPWFAWAHWHTGGEFTRAFFWYHNVQRAAGTADALASHPWWYYLPRLAIDFLPWTPAAAVLMARGAAWRDDPDAKFGLAWAGAMFFMLSAAEFKRAEYLLPLYPGLAIFVGCVGSRSRWFRAGVPLRIALPLLALPPLGWWAHDRLTPAAEPATAFAAEVRRHAPEEVILFRCEDHALAYHLGPPVRTLVEWADLLGRLVRPGTHHLLIPPGEYPMCRTVVGPDHLKVLSRSGGPRPLLLVLFAPWINRCPDGDTADAHPGRAGSAGRIDSDPAPP